MNANENVNSRPNPTPFCIAGAISEKIPLGLTFALFIENVAIFDENFVDVAILFEQIMAGEAQTFDSEFQPGSPRADVSDFISIVEAAQIPYVFLFRFDGENPVLRQSGFDNDLDALRTLFTGVCVDQRRQLDELSDFADTNK